MESLLPELVSLRQSAARDLDDAVNDWNVFENLLASGRFAAQQLEQWDRALELNAMVLKSARNRGAPPLVLAEDRFNDYTPLLALGRLGEATQLLEDCRYTFEAEQSFTSIGFVLGALAQLEALWITRRPPSPIRSRVCSYHYLAGRPDDCAIGHFNWRSSFSEPGPTRLARWPIGWQPPCWSWSSIPAGSQRTERIGRTPGHLLGPTALPKDFDSLCTEVAKVAGVHFRALFDGLGEHFAVTGDEVLVTVLEMAYKVIDLVGSTAGGADPDPATEAS